MPSQSDNPRGDAVPDPPARKPRSHDLTQKTSTSKIRSRRKPPAVSGAQLLGWLHGLDQRWSRHPGYVTVVLGAILTMHDQSLQTTSALRFAVQGATSVAIGIAVAVVHDPSFTSRGRAIASTTLSTGAAALTVVLIAESAMGILEHPDVATIGMLTITTGAYLENRRPMRD
jgi:hypothetical protein